jgi:uncharacterized protein (DUF983 family)
MTSQYPPLSSAKTGIHGLCPRCGKGHTFDGFLKLKPECEVCGLDYSFANPADLPAFFVTSFTCLPLVAVACCWIEVSFSPTLWLHLFALLPMILLAFILPMRPVKGWLINSQYLYKAKKRKARDRVPARGVAWFHSHR